MLATTRLANTSKASLKAGTILRCDLAAAFGRALVGFADPSPQAVSAHPGHDRWRLALRSPAPGAHPAKQEGDEAPLSTEPSTPTRRHGARPRYVRVLRTTPHSGGAQSRRSRSFHPRYPSPAVPKASSRLPASTRPYSSSNTRPPPASRTANTTSFRTSAKNVDATSESSMPGTGAAAT